MRRTESNFCGSREAAGVRASKSARCLRRSGIYEGLPIAFQRESCILYRGCTLAKKYNIPLAGQIKLVTRSLRRYAPCPHCIRSAHFNRVRLRVSPSAQDDAQEVMRIKHSNIQRIHFFVFAHILCAIPQLCSHGIIFRASS